LKKIRRLKKRQTPSKVKVEKADAEDTQTGVYIQKRKLEKLLENVEVGVPVEIAATALNIPIQKWLTKEDVVQKLSQAEARAITSYLKNISKEAKKSGSLSKEMLAILWPESFNKAPVGARKVGE